MKMFAGQEVTIAPSLDEEGVPLDDGFVITNGMDAPLSPTRGRRLHVAVECELAAPSAPQLDGVFRPSSRPQSARSRYSDHSDAVRHSYPGAFPSARSYSSGSLAAPTLSAAAAAATAAGVDVAVAPRVKFYSAAEISDALSARPSSAAALHRPASGRSALKSPGSARNVTEYTAPATARLPFRDAAVVNFASAPLSVPASQQALPSVLQKPLQPLQPQQAQPVKRPSSAASARREPISAASTGAAPFTGLVTGVALRPLEPPVAPVPVPVCTKQSLAHVC